MPRRSTGQVVEIETRDGTSYALRFRASGKRQYVTLGHSKDGWTRKRAETELQNVMADVRRGIWTAPQTAAEPEPKQEPTFHEFASEWFAANRDGWRESTRLDYEWQLTKHVLPFFKDHRLSEITVAEIDRYRAAKVREAAQRTAAVKAWRERVDRERDPARRRELEHDRPPRPLSATSINKTITRISQILDVAEEYGLIAKNPAKGRRRRVKASKAAPVWLDRAPQIAALLDAAGELDREARADRRHLPRRAMLATLTLAGLRLGELLDLRWRDVDLSAGRITVRASKTDAGMRTIDMLPALRDELLALKASRAAAPASALVFPTAEGAGQSASNVRNRILAPAVARANERLQDAGEVPLPEGVTPHKLRHTFASVLVALGVDPGSVMDQLGHTDPGFTLRVYRHGMRRDEASKTALRQLVGLADRAVAGSHDAPLSDPFGQGLGSSAAAAPARAGGAPVW